MITYVCDCCHRTCESTWTDEEAQAEAAADFPGAVQLAIVCDDCYRRITGTLSPRPQTVN